MTKRYVCTLEPADAPARRAQGEEMVQRLRGATRLEDGLELRLRGSDGTEELVADFVRDESRCCSFFSFETRRDGEDVVLTMTAPREPEAQRMVDAALEVFTTGEDASGGEELQSGA